MLHSELRLSQYILTVFIICILYMHTATLISDIVIFLGLIKWWLIQCWFILGLTTGQREVVDPVLVCTRSHTTGQREVVDPVLFRIGAHCLLCLSLVADPEILHIGCCRPLHVCGPLRGQTGKETRR